MGKKYCYRINYGTLKPGKDERAIYFVFTRKGEAKTVSKVFSLDQRTYHDFEFENEVEGI